MSNIPVMSLPRLPALARAAFGSGGRGTGPSRGESNQLVWGLQFLVPATKDYEPGTKDSVS